jgi:hypothetical protein
MAQSVSQSVDKHKGLVRIVYMCVIVSSISSAGSSHIYAYLIDNDQDNGHKRDPYSRERRPKATTTVTVRLTTYSARVMRPRWTGIEGGGKGVGLTPRRTDQLPAAVLYVEMPPEYQKKENGTGP